MTNPVPENISALVARADELYYNDVEFHAKVEAARMILEAELLSRTGKSLPDAVLNFITLGASIALVVNEEGAHLL